jgi:hypothetical protein
MKKQSLFTVIYRRKGLILRKRFLKQSCAGPELKMKKQQSIQKQLKSITQIYASTKKPSKPIFFLSFHNNTPTTMEKTVSP